MPRRRFEYKVKKDSTFNRVTVLRCQRFLTEEQQGFTLTATTAERDRSFTVTAAPARGTLIPFTQT